MVPLDFRGPRRGRSEPRLARRSTLAVSSMSEELVDVCVESVIVGGAGGIVEGRAAEGDIGDVMWILRVSRASRLLVLRKSEGQSMS